MSRRSIVLTLAAVALLAFVVWIATSTNDHNDTAIRAGTSTVASARGANVEPVSGHTRRSELDTQRGETREGTTLETSTPDEPVRLEQIDVSVVSVPARRPVAGARIRIWAPPRLSSSQRRERWDDAFDSGQSEGLLSEHTLELVTDGSGRTAIDATSGGLVVADAAALFGFAWLEPDRTAPLVVEVHSDFALAARVVDASGSPLTDVEVKLRLHNWGDALDIATATSDREGLARVEHAGWRLSDWEGWGGARVTLAIAGPLDPNVECEIDALAPPAGPVELRLVEYGELEVAVFDAGGRPIQENGDVVLWRIERPAPHVEDFDPIPPCTSSRLREGVALFGCVALEREFAAEISVGGAWYTKFETGLGPLHAGTRSRIEVRLEDKLGVTARLVNKAGLPLADREVEVLTEDVPVLSVDWLCNARTDDEGRVRIAEIRGIPTRLLIVVEDAFGRERGSARAALERNADSGALDLGDLVVSPMPTIAAGRVVDSSGNTLRGARVEAYSGVVSDRDPLQTNWSSLRWNHTRTDHEGRFNLRSEFRGAQLAVEAHWGDARSAPRAIQLGEQGLELNVEPTGAIRGWLRLDSSMPGPSLLVSAESTGSRAPREPHLQRTRTSGVDAQGAFAIVGLAPGPYDVRVFQQASDSGALAHVENVVVDAGEGQIDRRLNPLELAHRALTLRVIDEDGAAVREGACWAQFHDSPPDEWVSFELGNRRPTVASEALPINLIVVSDGYLPQSLGSVASDREVVLQRAPRLRLELHPALPLSEEGVSLCAALFPADASHDDWFKGGLLELGTSSFATGHARFVGEASVAMYVQGFDAQKKWRMEEIDAPEPHTIMIGPAKLGEQTFRIRVDPAAFKSALDALRQ